MIVLTLMKEAAVAGEHANCKRQQPEFKPETVLFLSLFFLGVKHL